MQKEKYQAKAQRLLVVLAVLAGLLVWIYVQYSHAVGSAAEEFKAACADCFAEEFNQRENLFADADLPYVIERMTEHGQVVADSLSQLFREQGQDFIVVDLAGVPPQYQTPSITRSFVINGYAPFRAQVLDSLLRHRGYAAVGPIHELITPDTLYQPSYTVSGASVSVVYPYNPLGCQVAQFSVALSAGSILTGMKGTLLLSALILLATLLLSPVVVHQKPAPSTGAREESKEETAETAEEPAAPRRTIALGHTRFDPVFSRLYHGDDVRTLTSRQAELLTILLQTPNELVPHASLTEPIWGVDSEENRQSLNVQISNLRTALSSDDTVSIRNVKGRGFMLVTI